MQKPPALIFDFDGVIIDSLNSLYQIYLDFLNDFEITGTPTEFDRLNGPSLREGVTYLKEWHQLEPPVEELHKNYISRLSSIYEQSFLHPHIEQSLAALKAQGIPMAVASSCSRAEIELVLNKFNLKNYFQFVISGDNVAKSKPNPAIYVLVRTEFSKNKCYIVEDSENGLQAAISAGLTTIFYNPAQRDTKKAIHYEIKDHLELPELIKNIQLGCAPVAQTSQILINITNDCPNCNKIIQARVDAIWQAALLKKPLFNGSIVCYQSHQKKQGVLHISCFVQEYKHFFAQLNAPNLNLGIFPIGVSGLLIDPQQNTLFGQRQQVSQYEGYYELIPSGSLDPNKTTLSGHLDFTAQLLTELQEETGIKPSSVQHIIPFCLVFDPVHQVYDIGCKLYLNHNLEDLLEQKNLAEYSSSQIIPLATHELSSELELLVPTSAALLALY